MTIISKKLANFAAETNNFRKMKRFLLAFGMLLMAVVMTAGPNLAPSAVITASSVTATNTDAHLAQTAGDGELTTCWATDSQAAGEWLLFTWSTAQTINKLQLTWDVETYTYARSFAVYAIDEMPEELKGKPLTAAMLPKSAKMIYSLSSRELAGINSEQFYTDDVTTKNLLILFGEPVAEGRGYGDGLRHLRPGWAQDGRRHHTVGERG